MANGQSPTSRWNPRLQGWEQLGTPIKPPAAIQAPAFSTSAMSPEQLKLLEQQQSTQKGLGIGGLIVGGAGTVVNALQQGEQIELGYDQLAEQRRQFDESLALKEQEQNRLGEQLDLAYLKTGRTRNPSGS